MRWEMNRVSTSEQIFREINQIAKQPLGIVVFGVDCKCKHAILRLCADKVERCIPCQSTRGASVVLKNGLNAVVDVLEKDSDTCDKRREMASILKEYGAKTVVGICIRNSNGDVGSRAAREEMVERQNATDEAKSPKDYDGIDYLIVIDSKDPAPAPQ